MIKKSALVLAISLGLQGCLPSLEADDKKPAEPADAPPQETAQKPESLWPDQVVARVNDKDILSAQGMTNLNEVILTEVVAQTAQKRVLSDDQRTQIRAQIDHMSRQMWANAYSREFLKNQEVTDEQARDFYDQWVAEQDPTEYKFKFARFDLKKEAENAIQKLKDGADVDDLPEFEYLTSPESQSDIVWSSLGQLPPMFGSILSSLSEGDTNESPIPSNQGYFVIHLEQTRDRTLPQFKELKDGIIQQLKEEKLKAHVGSIRESSFIQIR